MMYMKINKNLKHSIIKNGNKLSINNHDLENNIKHASIIYINSYKSSKIDKMNDEISRFFLDSVHSNYLKNR